MKSVILLITIVLVGILFVATSVDATKNFEKSRSNYANRIAGPEGSAGLELAGRNYNKTRSNYQNRIAGPGGSTGLELAVISFNSAKSNISNRIRQTVLGDVLEFPAMSGGNTFNITLQRNAATGIHTDVLDTVEKRGVFDNLPPGTGDATAKQIGIYLINFDEKDLKKEKDKEPQPSSPSSKGKVFRIGRAG